MNKTKTRLGSPAAAALSLGFSLQHRPSPFWSSHRHRSGKHRNPRGSAAESAKMGKDERNQSVGALHGTLSATQKIDQPLDQHPRTGN
jgi:hypothetical protein